MQTRHRSRFLPALLLFLAGSLAGCSNLPTQPAPAPSGAAAPTSGSSQTLALLGSTSYTTTKTVGPLGGMVSAGDFSLVIPPGALTTTAQITVSQPDPSHPVANLSISPASANHFLVPVVLTANASTMSTSLLSVAYISWYNPSTGQWEEVAGSSVSLATLSISAPLWHFSTYRVESGGKAGW
jgi:hypothetical protein